MANTNDVAPDAAGGLDRNTGVSPVRTVQGVEGPHPLAPPAASRGRDDRVTGMRRHAIPGILIALLLCLLTAAGRAAPPAGGDAGPDLIVHGGKIVTADEAFSVAEAMAVKGGKITAVGKDADVLATKTDRTEVIDLAGRTVLPGLIDSHVHPSMAAMLEFDHPVPTMESVQDVLAYVRARAEALGEGKWVEVRQVFITRLREQRYPTRKELDEAAPTNPVLFATGPDASLNSLALQLSGIDKDFKPADGGPGYAEKDAATGEPTGILRGCTRYVKVEPTGRTPTEEDRYRRTVELFRDYNAHGITTIGDRAAEPDALKRFERMRDAGDLTVRVSASVNLPTLGAMADIQKQIRQIAAGPLRKDDPMLRVVGIKTFLDGGMLTGSAYMREPWGVSQIYGITDPQYRGVLLLPRERLLPIVRTAAEEGLQFTAHSVGDGAVHTLLDVYREVSQDLPTLPDTRPCITHCNFMSAEAIDQMKALGAVADIQPAWLYLDTHTLHAQFGDDRLRYFQPLRSLFDKGVVAGGGSDHMQKIGAGRAINPYDPFLGMWVTVTRRSKSHPRPLHPEEALSREQMVRFYTGNNAYILFREHQVGSLEAGKLADFVVIDRDVLTCPVDEVRETKVLRTYLGGKPVWVRG